MSLRCVPDSPSVPTIPVLESVSIFLSFFLFPVFPVHFLIFPLSVSSSPPLPLDDEVPEGLKTLFPWADLFRSRQVILSVFTGVSSWFDVSNPPSTSVSPSSLLMSLPNDTRCDEAASTDSRGRRGQTPYGSERGTTPGARGEERERTRWGSWTT